MEPRQVFEKGLYSVCVCLCVLLAGMVVGGFFVTIPPVTAGGYLLRFEFMGNVKELCMVPRISNRYWYLVVPSVIYAIRCVYGLCYELDDESKSELLFFVRFMLWLVFGMAFICCPLMYWVLADTKTHVLDVYSMIIFTGTITSLSITLGTMALGLVGKLFHMCVGLVMVATESVAVNIVTLGLYHYPQHAIEVCIVALLSTVFTFVMACTLIAPVVFAITLVRTFFARLYWYVRVKE